jgi:hypothetical protein
MHYGLFFFFFFLISCFLPSIQCIQYITQSLKKFEITHVYNMIKIVIKDILPIGFFLNGAGILHFIGPNEPTINYELGLFFFFGSNLLLLYR